jgi:N-acetylmuramoyl-L-alanine amidase
VLKKIITFVIAAYIPTMAVLFIGCDGEDAYTPQITGNVFPLGNGTAQQHYYSKPVQSAYKIEDSKKTAKKVDTSGSYGMIPPAGNEKSWKAIVIHHSGTDTGNIATIDDYHRRNNGWDGIGYDFVIGNGSGENNGQTDSTFRWVEQRVGAHCKTDDTNWANENAIGICLIGNFDSSRPTGSQMASLMKLVRFLSKRYDIPASKIYGHNTTPGHSTTTSCPGRYFPLSYVKSNL